MNTASLENFLNDKYFLSMPVIIRHLINQYTLTSREIDYVESISYSLGMLQKATKTASHSYWLVK